MGCPFHWNWARFDKQIFMQSHQTLVDDRRFIKLTIQRQMHHLRHVGSSDIVGH
ncbi:Uncharacterised protein [Vibrio cholerae]|nr:Uncharacterised protein [Vibrio cholerae]CSI60117.1 Uncharacterised protein [Vibrio cholerae]